MTNNDMQRSVFISYATGDPDWDVEQVEAVALAIQEIGLQVSLDRWHQRDRMRRLSLAEWQAWMDTAIDSATSILCLISGRYRELWNDKGGASGYFGISFEATGLIAGILSSRRGNHRRILALLPENLGLDCIPPELAHACPIYRWTADRSPMLKHLAEAESEFSNRLSGGLILDGLVYPEVLNENEASKKKNFAPRIPIVGDTDKDEQRSVLTDEKNDIAELSIEVKLDAVLEPGVAHSTGGSEFEVPRRPSSPMFPPLGPSGLWPAADEWRAPVGDFPPCWASAWGDDVYGLWADFTVNGVTQRMRWIEPSGEAGFEMGDESEGRSIEVIKRGFWLADTPCTQAFWQAVTGENPSHFHQGSEAPERPVENVSWDDVTGRFITRFAQTPEWGTAGRLCLPSEYEWEYAARAGTRTAYWWGDDWEAARGNVDVTGKRRSDDKEGATPVRRYGPNPWGLFDVHGNVWEWCTDVWRPRLDAPEARPDEDARAVRGGSWIDHPAFARAACRCSGRRWFTYRFQGFRFALRSPDGPEAR